MRISSIGTAAARSASNLAERHHLNRQAARIGQLLRGD